MQRAIKREVFKFQGKCEQLLLTNHIKTFSWYIWCPWGNGSYRIGARLQGHSLNICLLVSSADDLCNRFGPRSGPKERRAA